MRGRREGRDNRRGFYRNKLIATMIIVMGIVISINSADNKTEFGVMDDFTVWGVEGTLADPDLEIKGFSVFGATQTAYTANIDNGPGNVMINGVLGVSSGAYIAGISTISYINSINTSSLTITGNGITGSSPIFKVAGSTMVILNDGRVGIGTTDPAQTLDVVGNINASGSLSTQGGASAYYGFGPALVSTLPSTDLDLTRPNLSLNYTLYRVNYHTGLSFSAHSYYGGIRFYSQGYSTSSQNPYDSSIGAILAMNIINGNVGVGTTDPSGPLHVKSGTTDIIKTDTSGRVTMPNQPAFYAYATAQQSDITTNETAQKVLLAGTLFNRGNHWDTSTSKFTAPVAGIYFFHGEVYLSSLGAGHYTWAHIYVNGSARVRGSLEQSADAVNYRQVAVTAIVELNAGDYVEFYETSYNTTTTINSGSGQTYFMGYLVQ